MKRTQESETQLEPDDGRATTQDGARIRVYFVLACGISWLFLGTFVILWRTFLERSIPWWAIVFLPGAYGPSIAALILVWRRQGRAGVVELLRRLIQWRVQARWYLFVFLLPILLTAGAVFVSDFRVAALSAFQPLNLLSIAPLALIAALPFGPLGEELGWRGYALPKLLMKAGVWKASLILGFVWTFWHLPMFWFPGAAIPSFLDPSPGSILLYLAQITAEACLLTFLYRVTDGSILFAVLFHLTFNTSETILFRGLPQPSAEQEFEIYVINIVLLWLAAVGFLGWKSGSR